MRDACCGARCWHCAEWRRDVQPLNAWCERCRCTVYLNEQGKCPACNLTKTKDEHAH